MFVFSGHEAYVEDRIKSQGEHKLFLVPGLPTGSTEARIRLRAESNAETNADRSPLVPTHSNGLTTSRIVSLSSSSARSHNSREEQTSSRLLGIILARDQQAPSQLMMEHAVAKDSFYIGANDHDTRVCSYTGTIATHRPQFNAVPASRGRAARAKTALSGSLLTIRGIPFCPQALYCAAPAGICGCGLTPRGQSCGALVMDELIASGPGLQATLINSRIFSCKAQSPKEWHKDRGGQVSYEEDVMRRSGKLGIFSQYFLRVDYYSIW